jgi:hypothetical protein
MLVAVLILVATCWLAVTVAGHRILRHRALRGVIARDERPSDEAPAIAAALHRGRSHPDRNAFVATAYDLVLRGRFRTVPGQTGDVVDIAVLPGDESVQIESWERPVEQVMLAATLHGPATLGRIDASLHGRNGDVRIARRAFSREVANELRRRRHYDHTPHVGLVEVMLALAAPILLISFMRDSTIGSTFGVLLAFCMVPGMFATRFVPPHRWRRTYVDTARAWHSYVQWLEQLRLDSAQPAAIDIEGRTLVDAIAFGSARLSAGSMGLAMQRLDRTRTARGERAHIATAIRHGIVDGWRYVDKREFELVRPRVLSGLGVAAVGTLFSAIGLFFGLADLPQVRDQVVVAGLLSFAAILLAPPLFAAAKRRSTGLAAAFGSNGGTDGGVLVRSSAGLELYDAATNRLLARVPGSLVLDMSGTRRESLLFPPRMQTWTDLEVTFVDGSRWHATTPGHPHGDDECTGSRHAVPSAKERTVWFDVGVPPDERAA